MMRSPASISKVSGQAQIEYLVCAMCLMMLVWYAFVGGVDSSTGRGGLHETEVVNTTGHFTEVFVENPSATPGLVQSLHQKQEDFKTALYKP
jgi:hypothetical protein